jgi:uroporphyrinogen-III decarboxylase
MTMTSKQRMLTALEGGVPDRMPVTSHHVMPYFLDKYMGGMTYPEFFDHFDLDAIRWVLPTRPDADAGEYAATADNGPDYIGSDAWRITSENLPDPQYETIRYTITTPKGVLTTIIQSNEHTSWVTEHLIKDKRDIDLIGAYVTAPKCDVEQVNAEVEDFGERGLIRGHIPGFDLFGQPGTWQDAACLVGIERLILATYDDPVWVRELLDILYRRKEIFVRSLAGARYDVLELGGGDASSTVISPKLFRAFVAPYDSKLIALAHDAGQRIVYHTCGGMMPILEDIAAMAPNAMETFTPPEMGGDTDLAEAKRRIGDKVCMIGGWDQHHYFIGCTEAETRAAVRRCFDEAGPGGGFILCPSDHFFDADPDLIAAFADEARRCVY